jgi:hypothetical protein
VTPAPPDYTFNFLKENGFVGPTQYETIERLLDWCRENLVHFSNRLEALNMEYQWQYRGFPPVSRIIEGTVNNSPEHPDLTIKHRTAGCHGTNGFLKAVLRTVNIPVLHKFPPGSGHATPHFPTERMYLSHGDDPYNAWSRTTPPFAAGLLLIDQGTYETWFPDPPVGDPDRNIGRQVFELNLSLLSNNLMNLHCVDIRYGRSHAESLVYMTYSPYYSLAELEAMDLWTRLDEKIESLGGCGSIP